ncbi:MAG: response regulator [candidate division KSB1 bacterium]|nr:response regulator [candidate division KSB1 bacterium]
MSGDNQGILLIEDEQTVRKISHDILQRNGYTVYVAKDGETGEEEFNKHKDELAMVLCDVVLPDTRGIDLVNNFLQEKSDLAILMCSGYDEEDVHLSDIQNNGYQFIQKPFNVKSLLTKVKETLQAAR